MAFNVIPRSIRGRLLLAALVFTGMALLFAGLSVGNMFERMARRGLDDRLDTQIVLLSKAVRADGTLDRQLIQRLGPFTQHERGWGWAIVAVDGVARSREIMFPVDIDDDDDVGRFDRDHPRWHHRPVLDETHIIRVFKQQRPRGIVTITAWAPRYVISRMHRASLVPWAVSIGALAAFLAVATFLQLRIGLRPLVRVKQALQAVRAGNRQRIPEDQPLELKELVHELNGLLAENEEALTRARAHVSNLAHGLKTPLATLDLKLREEGRDPDGQLSALVAQVEGAIRHHLGRARAASPGAPGRLKVELRSAVAGLVGVLSRIHAERGITLDNGVPPEISVKCDPQDLEEMLGNLLDNAWKWARSRIAVEALADGAQVRIHIDDDGPGLSAQAMDKALVRGQRLDEREDGHGFGLPIARELAELHGGTLDLAASPFGGLRAVLTLPG